MQHFESALIINEAHRNDLAELIQRLNRTDAGLNSSDAVRRLSEYDGNERHVRQKAKAIYTSAWPCWRWSC